jgi:hypothetical protein
MTESIRGWKIDTGLPVKMYPEGRVCSHEECSMKLSKYNPNLYCVIHGRSRKK